MARRFGDSDGGRTVTGVIVLAVGLFLLISKLGFSVPDWLLSWPMIFVVIGIISLVKHNFQSGFGLVMLLFGAFFLIKNELGIPFGMEPYLAPVGLIVLGVYLLLTKKRRKYPEFSGWDKMSGSFQEKGSREEDTPASESTESTQSETRDTINSQALFCGIKRRVLSKHFSGGKVSAFFGGTEIDLTQADLSKNAVLDVEVAFGGVKLLVPSNWDLKINVDNVFAGVEDKRVYTSSSSSIDPTKALILKGTVVFGGLEIKSF